MSDVSPFAFIRPRFRRRTGGRLGGLVLAAALGLVAAEVAAAPAGYVYYFRSFGQWTVICGREDATGSDVGNCTLNAPPQEIQGANSRIEIDLGGAAERANVAMQVRGAVMPDSPFYLRVDAKDPHQTLPNRFGEGGWSGNEAQQVIDELKSGQQVVVRWFVGPPPSPRDETLSLDGFNDAMADLEERLSAGAVSRRMPPEPASAVPENDVADATAEDTSTAAAPPAIAPTEPVRATLDPADTGTAPAPAPAPAVAAAGGGSSAQGGSASADIFSNHIGRAQLTSNVVNREPVDTLTTDIPLSDGGLDAIYYFTEVVDFAGRTVTHRWEYEGAVVATVTFNIGGQRWRVYSRKGVTPSLTGQWSVTASAPDGTVLSRATFTSR